jgi:hypothetical protein
VIDQQRWPHLRPEQVDGTEFIAAMLAMTQAACDLLLIAL